MIISYPGSCFQRFNFKEGMVFAWGWGVPANQDPTLQKTEDVRTITCRKEEIKTENSTGPLEPPSVSINRKSINMYVYI